MAAAFKAATETDTAVARTLLQALMPPRATADVPGTIQDRQVRIPAAARVSRGRETLFRRDTRST
jgi:hypothetical protein